MYSLALVVGHDFAVVLFLGPVDVGSLRSQPKKSLLIRVALEILFVKNPH